MSISNEPDNFSGAGFWKKNSSILAGQYPGLLEEITRAEDIETRDIHIETASSGQLTLKINGIYIHSNRDPAREGRRIVDSTKESAQADSNNSPIIVLGFGLGYTAQAASELQPDRPLIIIEKNKSLLRIALEQRDLSSLLARPNVVFIAGGAGDGIQAALSLFEESGSERRPPCVVQNRALTGMDEEWYGKVENRIRAWTMRDDVNSATLKRFGKRWVRNLSRNMACIRDLPGISRLSGLAEARTGAQALPVFLAAAGPGLDQVAPLLAEIQRRCIVVAVDTSLRFLLRRGISPDFVLAVDPQYWNSRHLDRCSLEHTRLIAESAVYPEVLRLPFKGSYLCGSLFPLGNFIEKRVDPKGELGAGGSVATTAWDFCRVMGPREIWIAGLDLAFPEFKTHFRGAAFEEKSHAYSGRLNPSETWLVRSLRDGLPFRAPAASEGKVLTDRRLSLYAAWFENRFSQHPAVRNYSLSRGGLAIAGLTTAGADSLLALPERRDEINRRIESTFSQIETAFFEPEEVKKRAEHYDNAVRTLLRGLEEIKSAAERGAKIAEQALKQNPGAKEQNKILALLDEITKNITGSEVKEVAGFLFPPADTAELEHENSDPFRAYLESSVKLYRRMAEAAGYVLGELHANWHLN